MRRPNRNKSPDVSPDSAPLHSEVGLPEIDAVASFRAVSRKHFAQARQTAAGGEAKPLSPQENEGIRRLVRAGLMDYESPSLVESFLAPEDNPPQ